MPEKENQFLSDLRSNNADVRFAAWRRAGEMDPQVVAPLAKLLVSENPGVAKAAREALNKIVHSAGKEPQGQKRSGLVRQLTGLLGNGQPLGVRVLALRQLSLIAGEDAAPAIAKWIHSPDLREEVVFCLERIPGKASNTALLNAYRDAKDDFKPRILAALGHRRAEEAVSLCGAEMRSPNREIAMAAIKAFGRIGKTAEPIKTPEFESLSDWEKIEFVDSFLRYADAQVAQGNLGEAWKIYKVALGREEEHWQCAAIIGIAKMGTPEAAAAIFPKLKSRSNTVRITAENAWNAMKKAATEKV